MSELLKEEVLKKLHTLQKKYNTLFEDTKLNDLVVDDVLSVPVEFDKDINDFFKEVLDACKGVSKATINKLEFEQYHTFWNFTKDFILQKISLVSKAILLQQDDNLEVIREIFETHVISSSDVKIENVNDEDLIDTAAILNTLSITQIKKNFSRQRFTDKVKEDFEVSDMMGNYIYDLIKNNNDQLVQKYMFKMLGDINERLKTLETKIDK